MAEKVEYILSIKDLFSQTIRSADKDVNKLEKSLGSVNNIGSTLKNTLLGIGAALGANEILQSTAKIESLNNSIKFISGTSEEADKNFAFLKQTTDKLGTSLLSATAGFKTIAGAARGTSLEGEATRQAFLGISQASAKMGLSGEQSEGALLALGQMISKGKVQAEELRGQLGERIPGAFQIAARAMGMTTQALDKFMADGKLMAEDFIPKFSAQLQKEFGGAMPESIQTTVNRFENLKTELMTSLIPAVGKVLTVSMDLFNVFRNNWDIIVNIGLAVASLASGFIAYNAYALILNIRTGIMTGVFWLQYAATFGLSEAFAALNLTMAANPVGLIIGGIVALGTAFYLAYKRIDSFRWGLAGIWQVIKDIGVPLGNILGGIALSASGNVIGGAKMIQEGVKGFSNFSFKESFDKGYLNAGLKEQEEYFSERKREIENRAPDATTPVGYRPTATSLGTSAGSGGGTSGISGHKPTTINITINKLVEKVEVHTTTLNQSTSKIVDEIKKALLTAVNDSQIIGN